VIQRGQAPARIGITSLSVVVRAGAFVFAYPVRRVQRLVLSSEVDVLAADTAAHSSLVGRLQVGGATYAAWELGRLMGQDDSGVLSWSLCHLPWRGSSVAIALGTGACLVVQPIPQTFELDPRLFGRRRGAIRGAFDAHFVPGLPSSVDVGLVLDVEALLTDTELEASNAISGVQT
jgi:hypothetical protein